MAEPSTLLQFEDESARGEVYPHGGKPIVLADRWFNVPPDRFALVQGIKGTIVSLKPNDEIQQFNNTEGLASIEKWRVYSVQKVRGKGGPRVRCLVKFYRIIKYGGT